MMVYVCVCVLLVADPTKKRRRLHIDSMTTSLNVWRKLWRQNIIHTSYIHTL